MDRALADIRLLGFTMDLLSSSVSQAAFDPELFTSAFVKSFQLLITASSYVNASWPENSPVKDGDHFDFIVVGCGTAGSVLSNRLTEARHIRLLCIEAGGDPPLTSVIPGAFPLLPLTPYDWHFQSEYDDNTSQGLNAERVVHTRGKMLGGSSSFDHLLIQRGSKLDYDSWAQEGNDGWNYESVLPYFKKAERMLDTKIMNGPTSQYHCDKGPFSVKRPMVNKVFEEKRNIMLKAYEEIGMNTIEDPLVPLPEGTTEGFLHITDNVNRRASAAEEYLLPCKDRPNFYLLKETLVTKIILNDVKEAIGVTVSSKFGKLNVFADLEVIISAGVFNSPKLLMLSGIGPKEELQKFNIPVIQDLPVGKNMQDHVLVPIFLSGNSSISSVLDTPLSVTDLGSLPLPIVSGIFSSSSGDLDMDHITAMFGILSPLLFYFLLTSYNFNLEVCKSVILTEPTREKIVVLASLGKPKSRGEVTLASNDPLIPPKIYNKYLYEGDDVDRMVETIKRIIKLLDTPALSGTGGDVIRPPIPTCDHLVYKSDEYWVCYAKVLATTSFRVTSTCSMGHVVDNKFKVKGIKNLRVIDDSVMPIVPTATLCAISVMMAEKGADLIKEQNNITEGVSENYTCN